MRGRRRPITTEAIGSAATHPSLRGALSTKQSRGHNMRGASNPDGRIAAPDRGREGFCTSPPSEPYGRFSRIFPHTALQSMVSSSGLSRFPPGRVQGEQLGGREEFVWPTNYTKHLL